MSPRVSVVIGASYGDEGKGIVTDYLSGPETLVIRFNGGAQAGHTVVTPEGTRHVFHHFGSGTLAGAATFLSPFFIVNPIFYGRELKELRSKGVEPKVYVDPDCIVTTPYDMLLNEAVERMRGAHRHGSCGFGINETVVRNDSLTGTDRHFGVTYRQLQHEGFLEKRLRDIRQFYVGDRANRLGIAEPIPHLWSDELMTNYMRDVKTMLEHAQTVQWSPAFQADWNRLVFEGAQGLRLDECSPDFPHVTRSRTGLTNVLLLMMSGKLLDRERPFDVYYVTRTYLTRHGAGPLNRELPEPPYPNIVDQTNIHNQHQGSLRFAHLDLDDLFWFIEKDLSQVQHSYLVPRIAVTCADQLKGSEFVLYSKGKKIVAPAIENRGFEYMLPKILHPKDRMFTTGKGLFTFGPTRKDFVNFESLDNRIAV